MADAGDLRYWRHALTVRARAERVELAPAILEELAAHLAEEELAAVEAGLSKQDARGRARAMLKQASFLGVGSHRRTDSAGSRWTSGMLRDLRLAARHLRHAPAFTLTALLTLAIGIGANTAVFTLVHAVLLNPLPVAHAERLYKLGDQFRCCPTENLQGDWSIFPYPYYLEIRDRAAGFEDLAASDTLRPDFTVRWRGAAPSVPSTATFVSGNYFRTLGVDAIAGRLLVDDDDRRGAAPVAVASYAAWRKSGLDRSAIGEPLSIGGVTVTLAGVAPAGFFGDRLESAPPDFWLPLSLEPTLMREGTLLETRSAGWLYLFGRLHDGRRPEDVNAQLTAALRNYLRVPGTLSRDDDRARIEAQAVRLAPGRSGTNAVRREYEQPLFILLAVSATVLLIACANLANLLLVRGAARRASIAVELAVGASRWQIVRRHVGEAVLLSLIGGAAGLLVGRFASGAILLLAFRGAPDVPVVAALSLPVFAFTVGVSIATGLLFGIVPALSCARMNAADALRGLGRVAGNAAASQRALIVVQAAASVVLVTLAVLLSGSLRNLNRSSPGFESAGRLIVEISPQAAGYTPDTIDTLYRRIDDRLSRLPGVSAESLALYAPQQDSGTWGSRIYLEGSKGPYSSSFDRVGSSYFTAVGTKLVNGRAFDEHDVADSRRVAVVNQSFARRFFPGRDPIGHRFGRYDPSDADDYEIVGVAADASYSDAAQPVGPMFFLPLTQSVAYQRPLLNKIEESSRYAGAIVLQVRGEPDLMAADVRQALSDVDPNLAAKRILGFPEIMRIANRHRTLTAGLSGAFAAIALLLAAVGLYGVTAYRVTQRRREIGVRLALGAPRTRIVGMIVRGACSEVALGLTLGVPLAGVAARAVSAQLFGVSPVDPAALGSAAALVTLCGVVASVVPARQASAIAPTESLRQP